MPQRPIVARARRYLGEPCISGTRAAAGRSSLAGAICAVVFCQNHAISRVPHGVGSGRPRRCARRCSAYGPGRAQHQPRHALHVQLEWSGPWSGRCRCQWCGNTARTNRWRRSERLRSKVDVYLPDLKYMDVSLATRYSAAPGRYVAVACAAIDAMVRRWARRNLTQTACSRCGVASAAPDAARPPRRHRACSRTWRSTLQKAKCSSA